MAKSTTKKPAASKKKSTATSNQQARLGKFGAEVKAMTRKDPSAAGFPPRRPKKI